MRMILTGFILLTGWTSLVAQPPVTPKRDKDLEALMKRVESRAPKEIKFVHKYTAESDTQKMIIGQVVRYWNALGADKLDESYAMMSDGYRKAISFSTYAKMKRIGINEVTIETLDVVDDKCARVRGTMWGNVGAPIGMMRVPMAIFIFKEGENWHVYQNPYNQGGFKLPMAASFKVPCRFKNK